MAEAEPQDISHQQKVVALVHAAFQEGRLTEESTWQAAVLIPNEDRD